MELHKTIPLTIRNFKAEIPTDFCFVVKVEIKNKKRYIPVMNINPKDCFQMKYNEYYQQPMFHLSEKYIYFYGSYSKWWLIKQFQRLKDYLFPDKALFTYIDYETWEASKIKKNHLTNH